MAKEKFDIETGGLVPADPQDAVGSPTPPETTGTYADDVKPSKSIVLAGMPVPPVKSNEMPIVGAFNSLAHRMARFVQTAVVHHHEQVHEVMAKYQLPTDDSVRLVVNSDPPTVLAHDDVLHEYVQDGDKVTVAPASSLKK